MAEKLINQWAIFYSWQSDLLTETNKGVIKAAMNSSIIDIENEIAGISIILDEATRNTAGSPDIPATIFDKISACDIFVCDITTINSSDTSGNRKVPNPNVLIELGYAIAILGWDRIIMLFNKAHGKFSDDVPFDISQKRILDFKVSSKTDTSGKGQLKAELFKNIKTIIEKNPLKALDRKKLSPEERKRNIDIGNLKAAMNNINIQVMDIFIEALPDSFNSATLHFWEGFRAVMNSSAFYIYNKDVKAILDRFYDNWAKTLSYPHRFRPGNSDAYFFGPPNGIPWTNQDEADYDRLTSERDSLRTSFRELLNFIRENYLEIDLEETSKNAAEEYLQFYKDFMKKMTATTK